MTATIYGGNFSSSVAWWMVSATRGKTNNSMSNTRREPWILTLSAFMLRPLAEHPLAELLAWRAGFIEEKIRPSCCRKRRRWWNGIEPLAIRCLIITATNRFITAIAELNGIANILATRRNY